MACALSDGYTTQITISKMNDWISVSWARINHKTQTIRYLDFMGWYIIGRTGVLEEKEKGIVSHLKFTSSWIGRLKRIRFYNLILESILSLTI